jgi:hypothetical protein
MLIGINNSDKKLIIGNLAITALMQDITVYCDHSITTKILKAIEL